MKKLLQDLRANKKLLERTYYKIKELNPEWVIDVSAADYSNGYAVPLRIEGYNAAECSRLSKIYIKQAETLLSEICEAETFIKSIDDKEIQLILTLRYVEGKTQEQIAEMMGCERETINRRLRKFWT